MVYISGLLFTYRRIVMPFWVTDRLDERYRFVCEVQAGVYGFSELCERFGISRPTGYKWVDRFEEEGRAGLRDRSKAPLSCPHKTPEAVRDLLCDGRRLHMDWGPEKLIAWLRPKHPEIVWPAPSTVSELFLSRKLVKVRRRRVHHLHPGVVPAVTHGPNDLWTADFKGDFRTEDRQKCYPLTIADLHTRFLLVCKGLVHPNLCDTWRAFERAFYEFGLPLAIRTDNGSPFSTTALHGLSQLNVWWMRLGIQHQRSRPACPQDNGAHERMHRTMKARVCLRPRANCAAQQRVFNAFRDEYNQERPHSALDNERPADLYERSPREYSRKLPPLEYPGSYLVKRVTNAGTIRFHNRLIFVSCALTDQHIALEEVDNGIWNVYFNKVLLGKLPETTYKIHP